MHPSPRDSLTEALGRAVVDLAGFINDPRQDWRVIAEAGLELDPVFMPLLVRLGGRGPSNVVELADELGRDHSTMSRQIARLEAAGLVERAVSPTDGRVRTASVTEQGRAAVTALAAARRRLLDRALAAWPDADRETLARLLARFVESVRAVKVEAKP